MRNSQANRGPRVLANREGLTLLETVVAMAIMAIGIVGVLHAFSASMIATKEAETYSTASIMANQVASQLDRDTALEPGQQSGTFDDNTEYTWDATIEPPDSNNLMRTTITITWGAEGNPRHLDMVVCLKPSTATAGTETETGTPAPAGASGGG